MNIKYKKVQPTKSSTSTTPYSSTRYNSIRTRGGNKNWQKYKIELEECIANHEKPVYGFPHMCFGQSYDDAESPDYNFQAQFESKSAQKMNKLRKLQKKNYFLPSQKEYVSIEGFKTKGAQNKNWKILAKGILNKDYEAAKPPDETPSSPHSPFKQYYSPRDSPKGTKKQGAAFQKSELIKILDQSWIDQNKEEQFWKDLTIGQEVYDRLNSKVAGLKNQNALAALAFGNRKNRKLQNFSHLQAKVQQDKAHNQKHKCKHFSLRSSKSRPRTSVGSRYPMQLKKRVSIESNNRITSAATVAGKRGTQSTSALAFAQGRDSINTQSSNPYENLTDARTLQSKQKSSYKTFVPEGRFKAPRSKDKIDFHRLSEGPETSTKSNFTLGLNSEKSASKIKIKPKLMKKQMKQDPYSINMRSSTEISQSVRSTSESKAVLKSQREFSNQQKYSTNLKSRKSSGHHDRLKSLYIYPAEAQIKESQLSSQRQSQHLKSSDQLQNYPFKLQVQSTQHQPNFQASFSDDIIPEVGQEQFEETQKKSLEMRSSLQIESENVPLHRELVRQKSAHITTMSDNLIKPKITNVKKVSLVKDLQGMNLSSILLSRIDSMREIQRQDQKLRNTFTQNYMEKKNSASHTSATFYTTNPQMRDFLNEY